MNIQDTPRSLTNAVSKIMAGHSIEKVELSEAKETTVPFEKMNNLTTDQWDQVQNFKNFNKKEWKWNATQKKFTRLKKVKEEEAVEEGNEFTAAAAKAKLAGKDEFEFDGKTYPVEIEQDAAEKILGKSESTDLEEAMNRNKPDDVRDAYGKIQLTYRNSADRRDVAELLKKAGINVNVNNDKLETDSDSPAFKKAGITKSWDSSKREKMILKLLGESTALKEAAKPSNGKSTIGLDVVDAKSAMKDMKKFNLKTKEGVRTGSADEIIITGKNTDIFKYLTSDYYGMDTDEIEEFYPDLYESVISNVDLEEIVGTVALGTVVAVGTLAAMFGVVKGAKYMANKLGDAAQSYVDKKDLAAVQAKRSKYQDKIDSITAKFDGDTKLQSMYKSLPEFSRSNTKAAVAKNADRTKKMGQIAKYIKSKLDAEELKAFTDISKSLRAKNEEYGEVEEMFNRLKPDDVRDSYGTIELKYRSSADIRDAEDKLKKAGINVRKRGDTLEVNSDSPAFKKAKITSSFDSSKREKAIMKVLGESVDLEEGTIILKTHSAMAAERLKKKLTNKFFSSRDQFIVKGSDLHIPDESHIVRLAKKQPEIKESTDLEEATELYKKGKITLTKFAQGRGKGAGLQVNYGTKFIQIPKEDVKQLYTGLLYITKSVPQFNESIEVEEATDLEEATMSQGVKTAATHIYSLEQSLRVGSSLNKGVNKSLEGNYNADFKKMQKAIGDIISVWEEIERDYSMANVNEVEEPKAQGEKDFKALHKISATDPEEAGNDQPIAPRP